MKITKQELKQLIKEELAEVYSNEPHFAEDYMSVEETHIDEVIKELHRGSQDMDTPEEAVNHPDYAYILGYQKALKDVAEKLLGIVF